MGSRRSLSCISMVLLLASCVRVNKSVLIPGLPVVPPQEVVVFMPGDEVPEHRRVAILEADYNDAWNESTDAIDKLREEAGRLGANGVVIVGAEVEGAATRVARTLIYGSDLGGKAAVTAYAILIEEPGGHPLPERGTSEPELLGAGSAFMVSEDGLALTNAHVVESCTRVTVGGETASVLRLDPSNDLALLRTELRGATIRMRSSARSLKPGEGVVVVGFPLQGLLANEPHVTVGHVTAMAGVLDDTRYVQISAEVQRGSSGGPVLDSRGHLVGIVTAKLDPAAALELAGDLPQNVNFAVKATVLREFLATNGVSVPDGDGGDPMLSNPEVGDIGRGLTYRVLCYR